LVRSLILLEIFIDIDPSGFVVVVVVVVRICHVGVVLICTRCSVHLCKFQHRFSTKYFL